MPRFKFLIPTDFESDPFLKNNKNKNLINNNSFNILYCVCMALANDRQ